MYRVCFLFLLVSTMVAAQEVRLDENGGGINGQAFVLQQVNGEAFSADRPAFIEFGEGKISGAVCNRFNGAYTMVAYKAGCILKTDNLASTRMACPNDKLAALERNLLRGLEAGMNIVWAGDRLELRRDDIIFVFARTIRENGKPVDAAVQAGAAQPQPVSWDDIEGKAFTLTSIGDQPFKAEAGRQPSIRFDGDGRVSGTACNNFTGSGELHNGVLTLTQVASTMMLCPDSNLSEFERFFHAMTGSGVAVELTKDGTLTLTGKDMTLVYKQDLR